MPVVAGHGIDVTESLVVDLFQEADMLRKVPMFAKLSPSKLKLLAFTSESLAFENGEVVFRAGEPADGAFLVMDGEVEILADTEAGEVVVGTLGKNELFGELALITHSPRSATLRARGKLAALKIGDEMFLRLLAENSEVALDVIRQLSVKLQRSVRQFEALQSQLQHCEAAHKLAAAPVKPS